MLMILKKVRERERKVKKIIQSNYIRIFDIPLQVSCESLHETSSVRQGTCNIYRNTLYMTIWMHMCLIFTISKHAMTKSVGSRDSDVARSEITQSDPLQRELVSDLLFFFQPHWFKPRAMLISSEQGNQSKTFGLLRVMVNETTGFRSPASSLDKDRCTPAPSGCLTV